MTATEVPTAQVHPSDQPHPGDAELWPIAMRLGLVLVLTAACVVVVETGWNSPVRVVLALAFLLFAPGIALAELLEIRDTAQRLMIASGASFGLETLLAIALVYMGAFSARLAIAILATLTVVAAAATVLRLVRSRRDLSSRHRSEA